MKFLSTTVTSLIVLAARSELASAATRKEIASTNRLRGLRGGSEHPEHPATEDLHSAPAFGDLRQDSIERPIGDAGTSPERPPPDDTRPAPSPDPNPPETPPPTPARGDPATPPPTPAREDPATPPPTPAREQPGTPPPTPPEQPLRNCSSNKKVTLYKFCITGDCDQGINGEHRLILNHFMDEETKYKENECHNLDFDPQHVEAGTNLLLGTVEYDDDEEEQFIKELHPDIWYEDICETYYIAVSKSFSRFWTGAQSWSGCWYSEHATELQPTGLNLDHCPENYYDKPQDSFSWLLRIESDTDDKVDYPNWYDSAGREFDCFWYSQGNRCEEYGDQFSNFGYTAKQACAACGGGVFL